jgi:SAM-dependent methyltransferase
MSRSCPICNSSNVRDFLTRKNVPVHQNLLCPDRESAIELSRGNLVMTVCEGCGFMFNREFDPSLLRYGTHYENTQTCSPVFERYAERRVSYLLKRKNITNCHIIEVGCGNGYFIKKLVEDGNGNSGIGFDPSYEGPLETLNGKLRFERNYYGPDCCDVKPDVVISRHVIEHTDNPLNLITTIHKSLMGSRKAQVYFETPCAEWILKNTVIWDFFYEHCSLFTKSSLKTALQLGGFDVKGIRRVFAGQYLWMEATPAEFSRPIYDPGSIPQLATDFAEKEKKLKSTWIERIETARTRGAVAVWGAGAKGATFLNLVDPGRDRIDCVIDINPRKNGNYIPGTGHEIIGIKQIQAKKIKTIMIMNPIYAQEIKAIVEDLHLNIELDRKLK